MARLAVSAEAPLVDQLIRALNLGGLRASAWPTHPAEGAAPEFSLAIAASRSDDWGDVASTCAAWHRMGLPYLLYRPSTTSTVLGPFVLPGRSACHECLTLRLPPLQASSAPMAMPTLDPEWSSYHLILEALRFCGGVSEPATAGRIFIIDNVTGETTLNRVLKHPACPLCSPSEPANPVRLWE